MTARKERNLQGLLELVDPLSCSEFRYLFVYFYAKFEATQINTLQGVDSAKGPKTRLTLIPILINKYYLAVKLTLDVEEMRQ